jgi:hypothetical protein
VPTRLFHRHDAYFKRLLDQPGTALALLRERLPTVVARQLVDEEPEVLPTSFISDDLEERRPDRLYRTRTMEGQPVLVALHSDYDEFKRLGRRLGSGRDMHGPSSRAPDRS